MKFGSMHFTPTPNAPFTLSHVMAAGPAALTSRKRSRAGAERLTKARGRRQFTGAQLTRSPRTVTSSMYQPSHLTSMSLAKWKRIVTVLPA